MKKYLVLVLIVLLIGALSVGVLAAPAGKSNVAHLYLYEKDAVTWDIVEGAWGKMKYNISGTEFDFVFNGHGLEPGLEYTLIYYPDPWPGIGLICLGSGTVNAEGDIHIAESVDTEGNLPIENDLNADETTTTLDDGSTGAKIWLVLTADVTDEMIAWNPTEYLFEDELITFDDTDI
ncbi:MAG: hypothetical protein MUP69_06335 [Candidatus Atribacteria bacterium]|nr:hypothetical protein [Candidatus Atribacteria bacterium]